MPARPGFRTVVSATLAGGLAAAALAGCTPRRSICGESSPGGGPPRVVTQDQELCEVVRLRTAEALARLPGLGPERAEMLRDRTWSWEDAGTLDGFLRRVREEGGEEVADAIGRAVADVRQHSVRPPGAGCGEPERCLVRGAALGARIAFDDAAAVLLELRRAEQRRSPRGGQP